MVLCNNCRPTKDDYMRYAKAIESTFPFEKQASIGRFLFEQQYFDMSINYHPIHCNVYLDNVPQLHCEVMLVASIELLGNLWYVRSAQHRLYGQIFCPCSIQWW